MGRRSFRASGGSGNSRGAIIGSLPGAASSSGSSARRARRGFTFMATSISYAELSGKTCFSFLRGASHPEELIRRAAQLGLKAIGIVDLNGVYGVPKAYQARKEFPGLKLLVGAEISLSPAGAGEGP